MPDLDRPSPAETRRVGLAAGVLAALVGAWGVARERTPDPESVEARRLVGV
jgi:hypothetical protein